MSRAVYKMNEQELAEWHHFRYELMNDIYFITDKDLNQPIPDLTRFFKKKRKNAKKMGSICPMCKYETADSEHHIVPRSYGGDDSEYNKIKLCINCHNTAELITDELLKQKMYSSNVLRRLIVTGAFL